MDALKVTTPSTAVAPFGGYGDALSVYFVHHMVSGALNNLALPEVVISLSTPPSYVMSKDEYAAVDRAFFKSIKIVAGPKFG